MNWITPLYIQLPACHSLSYRIPVAKTTFIHTYVSPTVHLQPDPCSSSFQLLLFFFFEKFLTRGCVGMNERYMTITPWPDTRKFRAKIIGLQCMLMTDKAATRTAKGSRRKEEETPSILYYSSPTCCVWQFCWSINDLLQCSLQLKTQYVAESICWDIIWKGETISCWVENKICR